MRRPLFSVRDVGLELSTQAAFELAQPCDVRAIEFLRAADRVAGPA